MMMMMCLMGVATVGEAVDVGFAVALVVKGSAQPVNSNRATSTAVASTMIARFPRLQRREGLPLDAAPLGIAALLDGLAVVAEQIQRLALMYL